MGALDHLPTLATMQAQRRAVPKHQIATRLETKTADDRDDAKQLEALKRAVRHRDKGRCRVCGIKVKVTLELDPRRAEVHHIVSRTCKVTRHDPRNAVLVCKFHHSQLTNHKLFVIGTAAQMFQAGRTGKWYLDATCPLTFTEKAPK